MIELVILATTDLHANLRAYDYYKDAPVEHYGMSRVATVVKRERARNPNTFLVDAGDFFQGSPLGDVYGKRGSGAKAKSGAKALPALKAKPGAKGASHPVVDALDALRYDAVAIGNHEFDFGLESLRSAMDTVEVPFMSANVWVTGAARGPSKAAAKGNTKESPLARGSVAREIETPEGKARACFFGLTPPQILTWNKDKLAGKLRVEDGLAAATRTAADLKSRGCHVVIAVVHGGFNPLPHTEGEENPAWHVAGLTGVDAVVAGHAHQEFPSKKFEGLKEADIAKGLVRGKPAVMPGQWGGQVGLIRLRLEKDGAGFKVAGGSGELVSTKGVEEDPEIVARVAKAHEETLAYSRAPVGRIARPVDTYLSRVESTAAVDLVNTAQAWYVKKALAGGPLAKLPLLSAAAPFKAGFKGEFTTLPKGTVAVKNVADLYVYPNTLQVVRITGAQVKDWLEKSSGAFGRVDPADTSDRPLLDDAFPTYNFDVISGVTYGIDVTKPAGERIVGLAHEGKPIDPAREFLVATNNYRAGGGGGFPHLSAEKLAWDSGKENREVLFDYVRSRPEVDAAPAGGWSLARVEGVKGRVWVDLSDKAVAPVWMRVWEGEAKPTPAPGFKRYSVDFAALAPR